jgi:hypothetical protein
MELKIVFNKTPTKAEIDRLISVLNDALYKVQKERKALRLDKIRKCGICGKEFQGFTTSKYCSEDCRSKQKKEYLKAYWQETKKIEKEKKNREEFGEKKTVKTDFVGGYESEMLEHEKAQRTLQKVKSRVYGKQTYISIPSLKQTIVVNRILTAEEIEAKKNEAIRKENKKWELLKNVPGATNARRKWKEENESTL